MAAETKFAPVQFAIKAALAKIKKWYMAIDQSDVYFICLGKFLIFSFILYLSVF
jgi:hypothetical protein